MLHSNHSHVGSTYVACTMKAGGGFSMAVFTKARDTFKILTDRPARTHI